MCLQQLHEIVDLLLDLLLIKNVEESCEEVVPYFFIVKGEFSVLRWYVAWTDSSEEGFGIKVKPYCLFGLNQILYLLTPSVAKKTPKIDIGTILRYTARCVL